MSSKVVFRGRILMVLIAFTVIASAELIYTSIRSLQIDREHLSLVEYSKNIDVEVAHSRIYLDDYLLFQDSLKEEAILNCFQYTNKHIASLDSFIVKKGKESQVVEIRESLIIVENQVTKLNKLISVAQKNNSEAIDVLIIDNYHDFQNAYQKLDKSLDNYIMHENVWFKRRVFVLVFAIVCLLVVCVVVIYRLINAYNIAEKKLANKSIEIEFKERKRIAADLHDGLGSVLSSIALFTKLIEKDSKDEFVCKKLVKVKELSAIALENLEAAINNLNPSNLNRYGLVKSLEIICEKINDMGKVNCVVVADNMESKLEQSMEINIYRICNELINNTLKHSGASKLLINIKQIRKMVLLTYHDNGKGFNPDLIFSNDEEKMGLHNIANRVESFGGKYEINSSEGNGVEIQFQFKI